MGKKIVIDAKHIEDRIKWLEDALNSGELDATQIEVYRFARLDNWIILQQAQPLSEVIKPLLDAALSILGWIGENWIPNSFFRRSVFQDRPGLFENHSRLPWFREANEPCGYTPELPEPPLRWQILLLGPFFLPIFPALIPGEDHHLGVGPLTTFCLCKNSQNPPSTNR